MVVELPKLMLQTEKALQSGYRRVIHQGGQYSGKTVNILWALSKLCNEETDGGVTTVTSMTMPHLKGGALRDFEMYVYPHMRAGIQKYHKTDHLFTWKNGSLLEFRVFPSAMDAHGHKRKRLFVNEANKFPEDIWFQLDSRSDQSVIDYNPSIRFWSHNNLIGIPGNLTIYSDHRDNPFLTKEKHAEIESICTFAYNADGTVMLNDKGQPIVLKGSFETFKVYARGLTGNVQGVIFPDWEMIDDSLFPDEDDCIFGIDYGYTNDPTAIIKANKIGDTLFVKELAYETGLSDHSIANILFANGYDDEISPLYSERDPDMIKQLRNLGLSVFPATKGPGSVNAGIEMLHKLKVKYTSKSQNLHRERGLYVWETEKDTGKLTNIPVDNNNHCFDAIRYAVYTRYLRNE